MDVYLRKPKHSDIVNIWGNPKNIISQETQRINMIHYISGNPNQPGMRSEAQGMFSDRWDLPFSLSLVFLPVFLFLVSPFLLSCFLFLTFSCVLFSYFLFPVCSFSLFLLSPFSFSSSFCFLISCFLIPPFAQFSFLLVCLYFCISPILIFFVSCLMWSVEFLFFPHFCFLLNLHLFSSWFFKVILPFFVFFSPVFKLPILLIISPTILSSYSDVQWSMKFPFFSALPLP